MKQSLADESWTVTPTTDVPIPTASIPARVPGCVHNDLVRAGLIEHPNRAFAELDDLWIGRADWRYACAFPVSSPMLAHERVDLVCGGLDTIAAVAVNGRSVGTAANMHHPHRFDVREALREGTNDLTITFRGPLAYAEECETRYGPRPVNGDWGPYAYVRKAACHFGWDWGPRAPTVGIWRDIGLHAWSGARLGDVRILVREADARRAVVDVIAPVIRADAPEGLVTRASSPARRMPVGVRGRGGRPHEALRVELRSSDRSWSGRAAVAPGEDHATVRLQIDRPALWWPRGQGDQPLYGMEIVLDDESDGDRWTGRTGLRRVSLDTTPDAHGSAFTLVINGRPVFCKGANWIPNGIFPGERDAERTRRLVERAAEANMNMLRVWGGGVYEPRAFYDACDELGIMVWQDFMFACATYPEEPPYPDLVEAEARHQVARLSPHPSVVLWCGGNENTIAYESWGWKERLAPGQTWGERYWLQILPTITEDLDPTRPYWPDSPYSGSREIHPNDPGHGDRHTWDARIDEYRDLVPRFVSEFGHQAPPNRSTWCEAVGDETSRINDEASRHRQRAGGGNARQYDEPLGEWFRAPADFDEWHYLAQILQARSIALAIEWLRAHRPHCMGALFWQLNDVWAGHTWSAIDSAYCRKPLWYAVRRAFAPRLLTIQPDGDRTVLCAVNDDAEPWRATATVRRLTFDGRVLRAAEVPIVVAGASTSAAASIEAAVGAVEHPRAEMVFAEAGSCRAHWFFARDRDLDPGAPRFDAELIPHEDGATLRVRAESLLRDVVLGVDRLDPDAEVDDHVVTLLPGETSDFRIRSRRSFTLAELTSPPVFACVGNRSG